MQRMHSLPERISYSSKEEVMLFIGTEAFDLRLMVRPQTAMSAGTMRIYRYFTWKLVYEAIRTTA